MGLPKLLFFVIGCLLVELTYPSNDYLEQWYSTLSDSRHECPVTSILTSANSDAPEIYTVAKDCSEPDARWDYNFISKIKPKKGGVFEGKGRISVPLKVKRDYRPEHNNYKFGFKHNKCLKFFQEGISRIQGNFVQDRIEGHVKIDFLEGGYLLGQARQSKLVGVVRHFDDLNKLQNVTIYGKNSEIELSVHKNSYGYFEFATPKSRAENRIHLSRDFNQIYSCEVEGEFLFRNCYESTDINSEIQKCNIILDDKTVKPSDPAILFSWNLQTKETFHNNANPYADESASWLTENVRGLLTKWIKLMDNVDSDPFWKEYDVNYPRLNPKRPEIVLSVPEFKNRLIKTSVNFTSGSSSNANEPVLEGSWNNGEITAKVPEDLLSNGIWSSLLKIHYANEESSGMSFHVDEPFVGTIGRLKQGKLHGIVRRFGKIITNPAHLCGNRLFSGISYIGRHEDGVPVGPQWRVVIGSGYIYGNVDEKGEFTGDDIAYIYPDFQTVMFGEFKNGIMIKARECQVEAVKFSRGIPELKFTEPLGPYFHHKVPTHE